MTFPVRLENGNIKQDSRHTAFLRLLRGAAITVSIALILFLAYKLVPNPYLCYGYKPVKISKQPIEFTWTGSSYQCRFSIANSGVLDVKNPVLQIYFIDGATVTLDSKNTEWQKNDDVNYFWSKNIGIHGGLGSIGFAERAQAINVNFRKKGVNRIGYIINSNGLQKKGVIRVINKY